MSLILVATVGGLLLELRSWCSPERRVGVRRGGARDTRGHGERAGPVVYDRPLCQTPAAPSGAADGGGRGRAGSGAERGLPRCPESRDRLTPPRDSTAEGTHGPQHPVRPGVAHRDPAA